MMGRRQDHHHDAAATTVNSSIALLQERFKELEKVKERREGKELLKLFSPSAAAASAMHFQLASQQQQQQPLPSLVHGSLTDDLSLNRPPNSRHGHPNGTALSPSTLWPQAASSASSFERYSDVDIDTSLHL